LTEWRCTKICARALTGDLASRRIMEKADLSFECDFMYGTEILPGWTEDERRGVKYSASRGKS